MVSKLIAVEDLTPAKDDWLKVEWNIGRRCNFDCSYCDINTHDNTSKHASIETFENAFKTLLESTTKKVKISWTGGEPFVHPKFVDIIERGHDMGIWRQTVVTNGSLPTEKYIKATDTLHQITFSYHFEHTVHDKIVNNILAVNNAYKDKKGQARVHMMMLPKHFDKAKEILGILRKENIEVVMRRIRPQVGKDLKIIQPGNSGMEGYTSYSAVKHKTGAQPYYSKDEIDFLEGAVS